MLLEGLVSLVVTSIKAILSIFPTLPPFPAEGLTAINSYVSLIITNAGSLLGLFVDLNTVKVVLPIVLVLIEFEHVYGLVMWLLRKIPFLGIK